MTPSPQLAGPEFDPLNPSSYLPALRQLRQNAINAAGNVLNASPSALMNAANEAATKASQQPTVCPDPLSTVLAVADKTAENVFGYDLTDDNNYLLPDLKTYVESRLLMSMLSVRPGIRTPSDGPNAITKPITKAKLHKAANIVTRHRRLGLRISLFLVDRREGI